MRDDQAPDKQAKFVDRIWRACAPFRLGRIPVEDLTAMLTLLVLARFVTTEENVGDELKRQWRRAVAEAVSGHPPLADLKVMLKSAVEQSGYPEPELFQIEFGISAGGATEELPWLANFMVALAEAFPSAGPTGTELARVCELLIERHVQESRSGEPGEFHTPAGVVRLMTALVDPQPGDRILDPACGTGGLLAAVADRMTGYGRVDGAAVEAWTLSPGNQRLARMNLALHGVERPTVGLTGPAALSGASGGGLVDRVVSNPPFRLRMPESGPWESGQTDLVRPHGSANFAWLQLVLDRLSPAGTAAMLMAPATAWSAHGQETAIRRQLVERGHILGVVALPAHLFFPQTSIPVHLWLIARDKTRHLPTGYADRVLFIDAGELGVQPPRRQRELTDEDVERIGRHFAEWLRSPGTTPDEPGFSCSVTHGEVLAGGGSLDPRRYIVPVADGPEPVPDLAGLLDALDRHEEARSASGSRLRNALDHCPWSVRDEARVPRVTLRELVERESSGPRGMLLAGPSGSLVGAADYVESGGVPVVMPKDLTADGFAEKGMRHLTDRRAEALHRFRLRTGDIVLARRGELGRCAVVHKEQEGWVCGTGCFILRLPAGVIPDYLAACLRGEEARAWLNAHATGNTNMRTISAAVLGDLPIPLPELHTQRALAEVMTEAGAYERKLRGELALLERVRQETLVFLRGRE